MTRKNDFLNSIHRLTQKARLLSVLSPIAIFSVHGSLWAADTEQLITRIGSDHPSIQGKPLWVNAISNEKGLSSIKYQKGDVSIQKINEEGIPLFRINLFGNLINIVKIKRGWPTDPKSTEENPAMDPRTSHLDSNGGRVTLSYILDTGLFSSSKYRHLPLEIVQDSNGNFKLVTANGSSAIFLYATSQENQRGLKSIEPVSASKFAHLTGVRQIVYAAQTSNRTDKGNLPSSTDSAEAKNLEGTQSGSAK